MKREESKHTPQIRVKTFVQPNWYKTPREIDLPLPQEDLDSIKKSLLSEVKAPIANLDRFEFVLQYMDTEMIISNEDEFYHMLADILQDHEKHVVISINKIMKKRAKKQFIFDEIGTANPTIENQGDIILNRPKDKMYNGSKEVNCVFCGLSNKDKAAIRDLGPFYGSFKNKKMTSSVHELCAIWTPEVYLDPKTDKMKNLLKGVKRSAKLICNHCGVFGGGLGCLETTCRKTYHFKCCLDDKLDCQLDYNAHTLRCPDHVEKDDDDIDVDVDVESVFCRVCRSGGDENLLILCEKCLKGTHTYCLNPPLSSVPEGQWYCNHCEVQVISEENEEEKLSQAI